MKVSGFSRHIFWSYKEDADIPVERFIKQVVSYGEVSDFVTLSEKIFQNTIIEVLKNWKEKDRYKKRIHFMDKIILENEFSLLH